MIGFAWAFLGAVVDAWLFVFCRMISNAFHPTVPLFYYLTLSAVCVPVMAMFTTPSEVDKQPHYNLELYMYICAVFVLFYVHVLLFSASW